MNFDQIDKSVQSNFKTSWRALELTFPEPGVAIFALPKRMKQSLWLAISVCFLIAVGGPVLVWFGGFGELSGYNQLLLVAAFPLISLIVIGLFILMHVGIKPWVFDKRRQRFWRQGKQGCAIGNFGLLSDAQAVQLCSQKSDYSDAVNYHYELNVVMKRPMGARVPIICHAQRQAILDDAHKLAEFLNVPLLDHRAQE